jgi:SPP1 gp7 family putative phage head morphogenesis protein
VIVELNGTSLKTARSCAHRFLERTGTASNAAAPRSYKLSKRAEKLERARMRQKIVGTRRLRDELLAILDRWRQEVVAAVRRSAVRENYVDDAAAAANENPTDAQRHAGNYQKGHVTIQGLDISIENPKGSTRNGSSADGTQWSSVLPAHYGYIKRTEGADGEHVDVYIGADPDSDVVFVIDQLRLASGAFDEHKVMIGYQTAEQAIEDYDLAFSDGKGKARIGNVRQMTIAQFKSWLSKGTVREADVTDLDAELAQAVAAGVLTDEQRQAIVSAVNAALASMDPKQIAAVIAQVQEELFQAGLDSAKGEVGLTWDVPPATALAQLAKTTIPFSQKIVDQEIAAINQALQDGIAAGEGIPQLADRIQDTFDDGMHILGDDGSITRVLPSDSWAEMVARTETSRAMNAGIMQTYKAAGVERVTWVAAEDERTCPECEAADGETVMMGQNFDDVDVDSPPAHPSCRCTVVSAGFAQDEAA